MGKKILRVVSHLFLWLFFLGFPLIFFIEGEDFEIGSILTLPYYWLFSLSYLSLFYFNYYFFIPQFYLKKKYNKYLLTIFGLFMVFYFLKPFILMFSHYLKEQKIELPAYHPLLPDTISIIIFIFVVAIGLIFQVIKQYRVTERRALQAEAEKATAELSFLKAQINPHFLFNTLNNIYSLSIDNHPDTSASIMKLSNLMRYITDDATRDFVPLKDEIASISDYISLQSLRHNASVHLDFSVSGEIEEKQIAPLILMTYIENAFKYGISAHEDAPITIKIAAEESAIRFFCQNKIFGTSQVKERTGVGLINTRQRLKHIYPNKHTLAITNENNQYTVELTLQV